MERNLKTTAYIFLLALVWDQTTWFGSGALAGSSDDADDTFAIRHNGTRLCLVARGAAVGLGGCDTPGAWWKWGSAHRLFNIATARCLGLEERTKALSLLPCDSNMLWWRCFGSGGVHTVFQMGLAASGQDVGAKIGAADAWTRGSSAESICRRPYRVVHTTEGNSAGAPCEFPFFHNATWHHGCLHDDASELTWCSTTSDYDRDQKKGYCLKPEDGCTTLFRGPEGGPCYEFVFRAAVTWHEALDSCRSQGSDLLSMSSAEALSFPIPDGGHNSMPERVWVGLHQLDMEQGWQWSDGSPLAYLRWEQDMPPASVLSESDCGVMNAKHNFETEACDMRLPYICKKVVNASRPEPTESVGVTACDEGWAPLEGWCYRLVNESSDFAGAHERCRALGEGGGLAQIHSLAGVEMIHTSFPALTAATLSGQPPSSAQNGKYQRRNGIYTDTDAPLDVWIGLMGFGNPTLFQWIGGPAATFTYWDRGQPVQTAEKFCGFYSGPSHGWRMGDCSQRLPFMCQKKGNVTESAGATGCPADEGWRRHGDSCYRVDPKPVSFKDRCDITVRNRFEQAFISRLLSERADADTRYFWTGLRDANGTGEYEWSAAGDAVTYANWGAFQPAHAGGCVVMSTARPVGRWEVQDCALFRAGSVCKKDLAPPAPPEPQPQPGPGTNTSLPCPDGWASREGISYCYKVFHGERLSRKRSWEEAERFCRALGAHLPSFTHTEEMRALHYIIRDSISDDRFFWVGMNRRDPAERSWEWSDGRPVSMGVMHQDFHQDDEYDRDCAAFKTMKGNFKSLFVFLLHDFPPKPFYATPFHCHAQLEWVCQIPRGTTPKTPEWYKPDGHHETSVFVDGTEFWFVSEPRLTYEEARLYCGANDSRLAVPRSFTAARQINANLPKTVDAKQSWWANFREPGRFIPMSFTRMRVYHSAFLGRCTSISPLSLFPELDHSCEQRLPFVCERLNVTLVERVEPLEPHPGGLPCGDKSVSFRDKCYTVMAPVEKTFREANELCQTLRGTLLSIADQAEQDFVTTLLPGQPQKTWIGLKMTHSEPEWVDGTAVSFLNFNPLLHGMLRPMVINTFDQDSLELCVLVFNDPHSDMMGSWDYTTCSDLLNVTICQHYADKPEEPRFPAGPVAAGNHAFSVLRQNVSWFEALEQCRSQGRDLASVSDTLQQAALTVAVSRARAPVWLGLFSEDEGVHYRWTDHSHTLFSRWAPEPTDGPCVYLDPHGFWRAAECERVLEGAVCHVPHEETLATPEDIAVKCPHVIGGPNWIPFKSNCYTFQLASSRWDEFNKGQVHDTCRKLDAGADILTIRNAQENEFIRKQLLPFKNLVQFVWLGLFQDDYDHQQMKWYDGTNVQYSNWREGRPAVEGDFRAGLSLDGLWDLYTNKRLFSPFQQRSIVACKLEKDTKEEYNQSSGAYERYGSLSYAVLTRRLSWFEALAECVWRGGHLASVHDLRQDAHVELIARKDGFPLWIGLSSQDAGGSTYEWSDGTRYDYPGLVSPAPGASPSAPRGGGGCVYVTPSGGWERKDCHARAEGAICYNTSVTTASQRATLPAAASTNRCPDNGGESKWVQFQDHCYAFDMTFYNYSVYSVEEARDVCLGLDAQLLTIKSKEENDFVRDYVEEHPLITSRVWLGMELDVKGEPVGWVDGSALGFSNFEAGGVAGGRGPGGACAVLVSAEAGLWSRVSCKDRRSRAVCKVPARSAGSPVALGFFVVLLLSLLGAIGFIVYKKHRGRFGSTVRYKRSYDEADTTTIITDAE